MVYFAVLVVILVSDVLPFQMLPSVFMTGSSQLDLLKDKSGHG